MRLGSVRSGSQVAEATDAVGIARRSMFTTV